MDSLTGNGRAAYTIGVDLGGTKILAGVFDAHLALLGTAKLSTKAKRGPEAVLDRIARCVRDAIDECDLHPDDIRAVAVGAPGSVDTASGRVLLAPNLQWKDWPLQTDLEKRLGRPVFVENDCNLATLAVFEREFKRQPRHLLAIFVGTGIGGGLILNGQLHRGFNHAAGEVGHMVLQVDGPECSCGQHGCFEALASRSAILKSLTRAISQGQKTVLTDLLGDDLKDLRSGDLRKAIRSGDALVSRIVQDAACYIGIAVGNLINILDPEAVVLGGGVIEALEPEMMPLITKTAFDYALPGTSNDIQIVATHLGDHAGILGAAVLAHRRLAGPIPSTPTGAPTLEPVAATR